MKRFLILLLAVILCLSGCKKKQTDIPGADTVPEDIDWRLWEQYVPASLTLGQETEPVLIALDAIHLAIYYDRQEQELLDSITIPDPLSDIDYSRNHLRILDQNNDGYDDICIFDLLESGDRNMNWWLWDPQAKAYQYAPEYSRHQHHISADITWQEGKEFINGTMDTPDGPQDLLILVEEPVVTVYLDAREEQIWGTAQIPEPLSAEALEHLDIYTYWECRDLNGDSWGDLQLPCRWEAGEDGSLHQYAYCWIWEPEDRSYRYDAKSSAQPVI